jgi:Family of unknown function (DUF5985)
MTHDALLQFLWGALTMAGLVAGLFFFRFWRLSRDRLFLLMGIAFWVLALNWLGLAVLPRIDESRHYVYLLRLLAFLLIIAGIVDKNRSARRGG